MRPLNEWVARAQVALGSLACVCPRSLTATAPTAIARVAIAIQMSLSDFLRHVACSGRQSGEPSSPPPRAPFAPTPHADAATPAIAAIPPASWRMAATSDAEFNQARPAAAVNALVSSGRQLALHLPTLSTLCPPPTHLTPPSSSPALHSLPYRPYPQPRMDSPPPARAFLSTDRAAVVPLSSVEGGAEGCSGAAALFARATSSLRTALSRGGGVARQECSSWQRGAVLAGETVGTSQAPLTHRNPSHRSLSKQVVTLEPPTRERFEEMLSILGPAPPRAAPMAPAAAGSADMPSTPSRRIKLVGGVGGKSRVAPT